MTTMTAMEISERLKESINTFFASYTRETPTDRVTLSLSQITSCPRYLVFRSLYPDLIKGAPYEEDDGNGSVSSVYNIGVMVAGLWWEEFLANYAFPQFHRQCITFLEGIVGHCDFLHYNSDEGKVTLLECKTRVEVPDHPYLHHVIQISAYMLGIKENGFVISSSGERVDATQVNECSGYLIYISRDNPASFKVFEIEPDPQVRNLLLKVKEAIRKYNEEGIIPSIPKDYTPVSFPCFIESRYGLFLCPFYQMCWGNYLAKSGGEGISIPATLLEEAFRRWLQWKESEQSYKHLLEDVIKPMCKEICDKDATKSLNFEVKYLNTRGLVKVYRRMPPARLNLDIMRRIVQQITSYEFSDSDWETVVKESKERDGEPIVVVEFTKIK